MANFGFSNSTAGGTGVTGGPQVAVGAVYKTLVGVIASTVAQSATMPALRRGKIYDILIGTNSATGDTAIEYAVQRIVNATSSIAAGVLSSFSSNAGLDPADLYFGGHVWVNSSAVSGSTDVFYTTVGNQPFYVGVNQRASYRWVAAPGSELVYPAVTTNGLALCSKGPSGGGSFVGTCTGAVLVSEQ